MPSSSHGAAGAVAFADALIELDEHQRAELAAGRPVRAADSNGLIVELPAGALCAAELRVLDRGLELRRALGDAAVSLRARR